MIRVKTSHKRGEGQGLVEKDRDSGLPSQMPFATFVPDTSSSRTYPGLPSRWVPAQESLLSQQSSLIWPKQGTWDLGYAYDLPMLELPIEEKESSSLLPTPGANDSTGAEGPTRAERQRSGKTGGPALRDIGYLLPTPTAQDGKHSNSKKDAEYNPHTLWSKMHVIHSGGNTNQLSEGGNQSSEEMHPDQLTIEDV